MDMGRVSAPLLAGAVVRGTSCGRVPEGALVEVPRAAAGGEVTGPVAGSSSTLFHTEGQTSA